MIGKFHHVGIACKKIETAQRDYEKLGFSVESDIFTDPIQKIHGLFLIRGDYRIELLQPATEDSPVTSMLKKGVTMYHHAFVCDDLESASEYMRSIGAFKISGPNKAVAFDMRPVSFFMLRNQNMIELIQA